MKARIIATPSFWKHLTNFWTFLAIGLALADFFASHQYRQIANVVGIVYLAILGIYAGNKEFDRWYEDHKSRFRGEAFVIIWTVILTIMILFAISSPQKYQVSEPLVTIYTAVIGIFALTQRSKALFMRKSR